MLVPDLWRELVKLFLPFSANITCFSHITLGKEAKQQIITALVLTVVFMSVSSILFVPSNIYSEHNCFILANETHLFNA